MKTKAKVYFVNVGKRSKGVQAKLCEVGYDKLQKHDAKLQPKKAEGKVDGFYHGIHVKKLRVKQKPHIRARYQDPATGEERRIELGKFLLDSKLPVAHINSEPLDFRLENLIAQETPKQKAIHERAASKRAAREARSAKSAAKRALRPQTAPDGLTPAEQEAKLCSGKFQRTLRNTAYQHLPHAMRKYINPADIVNEVTAGCLKPIREDRVDDIGKYAYTAVRTQARKHKWPREVQAFDPSFGTQT